MNLETIRSLLSDDLKATDALILDRLASDVVLINQIGRYIINSGGKRFRPLLVLLGARACGYEGTAHHVMAAAIEFIHTSTLLHDDVVDESHTRRGHRTANDVWGNAASVLVGDYLYSRSFQLMVEPGSMRLMEMMAEATNVIAMGEVMQLLNIHNAEVDEAQYMEVIYRKTAKLFEAGLRVGPILVDRPDWEEALALYGCHLGAAFQLVDDALDYMGDPETLGKNVGDDLSEGKPTLPLIYVLHHGEAKDRELIRTAIEAEDGSQYLEQVLEVIKRSGALDYTLKRAREEAGKAKNLLFVLPDTPYREALASLADLAVQRDH